jgi:hypothetical protein
MNKYIEKYKNWSIKNPLKNIFLIGFVFGFVMGGILI